MRGLIDRFRRRPSEAEFREEVESHLHMRSTYNSIEDLGPNRPATLRCGGSEM